MHRSLHRSHRTLALSVNRASGENARVSTVLPVNLDDLLRCRAVESARVEFKAGWDPKTTGFQVIKTLCAFANDYHNLNGGYVVIGVAEQDGRAALPPIGLDAATVETAQKWIRGNCNRIDPEYQPIMSPEFVSDRAILVLWAPASETKPHRAPGGPGGALKYWIRLGPETVDAEANGMLKGLVEQTARVPWDDRRVHRARIEDLRVAKVREFLRDVRSGLLDVPEAAEIYRRLRITARANDHELPRNVGLLFFSDDPEAWFPGARIEVVEFPEGAAGDVLHERVFRGGLADQLRDSLRHLEGLVQRQIRKEPDRIRARVSVSYPLRALREALVNAVYHRSYQPDALEPTKVYVYPDRIDVTSYPGPVPGIEPGHLVPGATVPAAPARNRRIGELLKGLELAEGRLTGLSKIFRAMEQNGSQPPRFDFDAGRTWFRASLPIHPEYGTSSSWSSTTRAAGW